MKKAFLTMDVELLEDTGCLKEKGIKTPIKMLDGVDEYLNLLDKYQIKSTFFALAYSYEDSKDFLRKIIEKGHEIALHGYYHELPSVEGDNWKDNVLKAKKELEDKLNIDIVGYRAPSFSLLQNQFDELKDMGFKYDSSCQLSTIDKDVRKIDLEGFDKDGGIFRKDGFYELPLQIYKKFPISGGGFTRLFPFSFSYRRIKKYIKDNDCFVFYFHPLEVSKQKMPKFKGLGLLKWLYLHRGRKRYIHKIEKIIKLLLDNGFTFQTCRDGIKDI